MIRIGINGFGRIGRAFFRINLRHKLYEIVAINDIDPDLNNMAYLLKYDTTYGKLDECKISVDKSSLLVNGKEIKFYSNKEIDKVPWIKHKIDIVIESSGVQNNVVLAKKIIKGTVKKVIITNSPKEDVDFTFMFGVNENDYIKEKHNLISGSICDANALAPFYKVINDNFGIEAGTITTLHPWLSYQNLLDGPIGSVSSPGHYWRDYALGRASIGTMIPKPTTLVSALSQVIPEVKNKLTAISFRTPTAIVSIADGTFILEKKTTLKKIVDVLTEYSTSYEDVLNLDNRSLISIDYLANEKAAVVDLRWLILNQNRFLKFVLWYDNEWGYTKRIYNLIELLF